MFVLGTAGHVDHGKSTLLRALTGMEPDRLPEEKKRGMTIDLNFVWCELASQTVGVVDVPGHQKFVGNLVAGLSGIDGFIFVVAADDGWMPQSEEHLNLLRRLKIDRGVVVLTKVDLVTAERVQEVTRDLREKFDKAPVVSFSAEIAGSLENVKRELAKLVTSLPEPRKDGPARLWVDRVFSPKGQGTVVTGTLRDGGLRVGEEVTLFPSNRSVLIRGLQSHGKAVERATPNCRLAIQLGAGDTRGLKRGELVTTDSAQSVSRVVDVVLNPDGKFAAKKTVKVGFHVGTLSTEASFTPLSVQDGVVCGRLRIASKVPVKALDRFVLRTSGEERTIGCGVVVDTRAEMIKLSHARAKLSALAATAEGNAGYILSVHRLMSQKEAERLPGSGKLPAITQWVGDKYFDRALWNNALEVLQTELSEKNLVERLGITKMVALELFAALEARGLVVREGGKLRLRSVMPSRDVDEKMVDDLLPGLTPILLSSQLKDPKTKNALQKLILDKKIVRLAEDHFLSASAYAAHSKKVEALIREKGIGTTSELKDILGCSRKFAVMILERMDSDRVTYLKDGVRKLLKA